MKKKMSEWELAVSTPSKESAKEMLSQLSRTYPKTKMVIKKYADDWENDNKAKRKKLKKVI